jgi:hypothetical protein
LRASCSIDDESSSSAEPEPLFEAGADVAKRRRGCIAPERLLDALHAREMNVVATFIVGVSVKGDGERESR